MSGNSDLTVCGLARGEDKRFRCPYCGMESDDVNDFAVSMCWPCVYDWPTEDAVSGPPQKSLL